MAWSRRRGRWGLVAALSCLAAPGFAFAFAGTASAQAPAGPSLQVIAAELRQSDADLQLRLRFSRTVPVAQFDPSRGRVVCLVLAPAAPTRRRVCLKGDGRRLRATMAPIGADGLPRGPTIALRRARVAVAGDFLVLTAPARSLRVRIGRPVAWLVLMTWKDGGPCEREPGPRPCAQAVPAAGVNRLRTRGPRGPAFARRGHLRVLATGDSMIQIVDGLLKQRLERRRGASVRSDARISTGISKTFELDWVARAREQARSLHPDVTVISLGANDGFPMKLRTGASVACCDGAWVAEYARRVESMMRSYLRGGRSYVYWMTLPAPRRGDFARIYRAINAAIRRAGERVGGGARVVDLVPVFTPGGRFRQHVTFRGRRVNARQQDGVHLSVSGASIVATLLVDRLRADRALPSLR